MRQNIKLRYCVLVNALLLAVVLALVFAFASDDGAARSYLHIGPHDNLFVLGVRVHTTARYTMMLVVLAVMQFVDVVAADIGNPILGFSIYNPDKKVISDFSRTELQALANATYLLQALRSALMIVVSITQVDIALVRVVAGECAAFFTIRNLLGAKQFGNRTEDPKPEISSEGDVELLLHAPADVDSRG